MRINKRLLNNATLVMGILTGITYAAAFVKWGSVVTEWTIPNVMLYVWFSRRAIAEWGI